MATLAFEGLPPFSYLGGSVEGAAVLTSDKEFRARSLAVSFRGRELGQVTVSRGKSSEVIRDERVFLEQSIPFDESLVHDDPNHVRPGTYRLPFHFDVPLTSEPSIATAELPVDRGRFDRRPDGMYVEYEVEAKLDVPWWIDPVVRHIVPVYHPRRILGVPPTLASSGGSEGAEIRVNFDPGPLLPGTAPTGSYEVLNPGGKELRYLLIQLTRRIEYNVRGYARVAQAPALETNVPLGSREPTLAGRFQFPIPNAEEITGPFTGLIYRTYWSASAHLNVAFGMDRNVEGPLVPA